MVSEVSLLKFLASNIFVMLGGIIGFGLMILIFYFFVRTIRGVHITDLFLSEGTGKFSFTRFWANIAYFSGTIAFLSVNLIPMSGAPLEMIWLIYMAVVASNAVADKWIAAKYSHREQYQPPYYPRYPQYYNMKRNNDQPDRGDEITPDE